MPTPRVIQSISHRVVVATLASTMAETRSGCRSA
jgi:hypothetical protein